jgi:undecaprenyl-diphosphatase
MYLGVHTPMDVCVSLLVALALVLILYPVFSSEERFNKLMPIVVGVSVLLTLSFFIYVNLLPTEGLDPHNLESGLKNGATLLGCMLGLLVVYPIDRFIIKFETGGNWYSQVIKLVLGLGGVLAIKEGTRWLLELVVGLFTDNPVYIARCIRYLLIVVFAGVVWPLTFKFFANLKIGFMDRFTEDVRSLFVKKNEPKAD